MMSFLSFLPALAARSSEIAPWPAAPVDAEPPDLYDIVVVGGGPSGATAADDLAKQGHKVLLLDRNGRIKPCGGAIPPRLIRDFAIPEHLLVARATCARMISPSNRAVDMPVENGFVGMVDRDVFDEFLRGRAAEHGATRQIGTFQHLERDGDGCAIVVFEGAENGVQRVRARCIIGADGARSGVGKLSVAGATRVPCVFAYHEIISATVAGVPSHDPQRCDVFYQGTFSPDFYSWVFPHGDTMSIGTGSANKGFGLRPSITALRAELGLSANKTIRREGAPIPMRPLKKWDNGRDVVLAGDAAGVVAPASGEGIYYAMLGGRLAADAAHQLLITGQASALKLARKRFMKDHGRVFWVLGIMQYFWYSSDKRRERFVSMCEDPDVQRLTWQAYMNKELVRADPLAHVKIFFKDLGHLLGLVKA